MNRKYKLTLLMLSLALGNTSAQELPLAWTGRWAGSLEIVGNGTQHIPMSLVIKPIHDNTWSWSIQYGTLDKRDYTLQALDTSGGRFLIDEGNSIVLDAFYAMDCLNSIFEVEGSLLHSQYCLLNDTLLGFEISMARRSDAKSTGGRATEEGELIPAVSSFPLLVSQKAILRRDP